MTQQEQHEIIGKTVTDYCDVRSELAALLFKVNELVKKKSELTQSLKDMGFEPKD